MFSRPDHINYEDKKKYVFEEPVDYHVTSLVAKFAKFEEMYKESSLYGLVVCGGNSSRMGCDKSMLTYYKKPQRYHLYEMLEKICEKVFISCNAMQAKEIGNEYSVLTDFSGYQNTGPVAALLTAFKEFPLNDFLIVGCDYPFISENDLKEFLVSLKENKPAAAFYNTEVKLYEPLLAWYSSGSSALLTQMFQKHQYSLQHFLKTVDAEKFYPVNSNVLQSVDTTEEFETAKDVIKNKAVSNNLSGLL